MIIGITGTLASGKGAVVDFLKSKGFNHYSASGFLVKEIEKRNMPVNRDSMVIVGNDLRRQFGSDYIAQELYNKAKEFGGNSIIESLRTVGEINALKNKDKFYLFAIDADQELRHKRAMERKSEKDFVSFEIFKENEEREMNATDQTKQNLSACIALADYKILNNGSLEELQESLSKIMEQI